MDYKKLSKQISYALRHAPWKYGLELDGEGWANLRQLLKALQARGWRGLTEADLQNMIRLSDKQRFEIAGNRIRALYGHSIPQRIVREPVPPPEVLFHGTARRYVPAIREKGLLPGGRQYIHLSVDVETTLQVGKRHDPRPVVLKIDAKRAWNEGICFFRGNDQVWLADAIPGRYIEF
ncbi:MAG: putative 2-phosphotransferase [Bacillota bacterium]|nr:putative 2-phosphotransferase [Bacillota bacterium]MDN5364932.1 putative 2-phosphotransferase [Thermacetogenium sp.]